MNPLLPSWSELCARTHRPMSTQKSPRMVPGADSLGLVSPSILRPVFTTPWPVHQMGKLSSNQSYRVQVANCRYVNKSQSARWEAHIRYSID